MSAGDPPGEQVPGARPGSGPGPGPGPAGDAPGPDAGLAGERTELAWERSGLSLIACGVAVARGVPWLEHDNPHRWQGFAVLLLGVLTWLMGYVRQRQRRPAPGTPRPVAARRDLASVAYGTAAVAAAAFVVALLKR